VGIIILASAAICQSIIDVTNQQATMQALPEMVQNFETKCGACPLIYGKPCGSDKRI